MREEFERWLREAKSFGDLEFQKNESGRYIASWPPMNLMYEAWCASRAVQSERLTSVVRSNAKYRIKFKETDKMKKVHELIIKIENAKNNLIAMCSFQLLKKYVEENVKYNRPDITVCDSCTHKGGSSCCNECNKGTHFEKE